MRCNLHRRTSNALIQGCHAAPKAARPSLAQPPSSRHRSHLPPCSMTVAPSTHTVATRRYVVSLMRDQSRSGSASILMPERYFSSTTKTLEIGYDFTGVSQGWQLPVNFPAAAKETCSMK